MPRARNKDDLMKSAAENYAKLTEMIEKMTENQMNTPFDFSGDASKKEAHWGRDINVRDVLIHLYEWHLLMIQFMDNNAPGKNPKPVPFLPPEYNWKTYGDMNRMFWDSHRETSYEDARAMLEGSHRECMELAESLSDEELFTRGYFDWTGNNALGSYFTANMSSHYDWALKKIKAHIKKVGK